MLTCKWVLYMNPHSEAIPCCAIEHLITLQKVSFFAINKQLMILLQVLGRLQKKRKNISFLSSKCFPCRVKHLPGLAECTLGSKRCSWIRRLEGLMQPSCYWDTAVSLPHQSCLSRIPPEYHSRHLKRIRLIMINIHKMKRHKLLWHYDR